MPSDALQEHAALLLADGFTREGAVKELLKAIALNQLPQADAEAVKEAVGAVYGPDEATTEPTPLEAYPELVEARPEGVEGSDGTGSLLLPTWEGVRATNPPRLAPSLIDGLLRLGHVGLLVARAKSGKSWAAIALSIAVATGAAWLGFACSQGRVLYIDPELDRRSLDRRFRLVADAMHADPEAVDRNVMRWSLRGVLTSKGQAPTIADVAHDVSERARFGDLDGLALVLIDSCSALLAGDENASGDVRAYFNWCLRISQATGAAVALVHHEGKAMSGDRDGMARGRGSSAWADCPDLVLSLVETFPPSGNQSDYLRDGQRAFTLETAAIREFAPVEPRRLIWQFPTFTLDAEGVTEGWRPKSSAQAAGRTSGDSRKAKSRERADVCVMALLAHMYRNGTDSAEGLPAKEAATVCSEATGSTVKAETVKRYVEASDVLDVWQRSPQRWFVVPRHPQPSASTT